MEEKKYIGEVCDLRIQFGSVFSVNIETAGAIAVFMRGRWRQRLEEEERRGLGNKVL